jgi:hypothetical protein
MRKIILTFGLIAGVILAVMFSISLAFHDQIGLDAGMYIGYTSMVLAFLMVFFGVRAYRDNVAGGSVRFGRAFLVGLGITAVATVCYVATWEVIYYKFMPDFYDKYAAVVIDRAKKSGASEAAIAAKEKEMAAMTEAVKNPLVVIAYTILEPLPVGLVFTLIAAGVLSRKKRINGLATA